jgi:hypothetical protein
MIEHDARYKKRAVIGKGIVFFIQYVFWHIPDLFSNLFLEVDFSPNAEYAACTMGL